MGEYTCRSAAGGGHLEVLQYAHENGCRGTLGEYTCENGCPYAAEGGHLEVLKYAHENGCPLGEYTCRYAAGEATWRC